MIKSVDTKVLVKIPDVRSLQTKKEGGLLAHVQSVELVGLEVAFGSNKWNEGDTVYFQASTVMAALSQPFTLGDQKVAVLEDAWVLAYKKHLQPGEPFKYYRLGTVGQGGSYTDSTGTFVPFKSEDDGA